MIAPTHMRKPENWQDFEKLCKKLWGEIWDCSDTIKRNGRSGQKQDGVDVYGIPKGENRYYGIQCKGKDDYTNSVLTSKEVDEEIEKAKGFKPALKQFIFTTTANKDVAIEEYVRQKDIENRQNGLFEVCLFCWEDIVDLIEERQDTYDWYINNCQYKDNSDIEVSFNGCENYTIHPEYIRTTTLYKVKEPPKPFIVNGKDLSSIMNYEAFDWQKKYLPSISLFGKAKIDYRWCTIPIRIVNVGTTTLRDYKLYFWIDQNSYEKLHTGVHYETSVMLSDTVRNDINRRIDENREVYESAEFDNELVYIPNDKVLVQTDRRLFSFKMIPKQGIQEILLNWDFKSHDYHKTGVLKIFVEPIFEEHIKTIEVEESELVNSKEIIIEPKIVEE